MVVVDLWRIPGGIGAPLLPFSDFCSDGLVTDFILREGDGRLALLHRDSRFPRIVDEGNQR